MFSDQPMSKNWVFEHSSGYAGWRCIHCAVWKYNEDNDITCDCPPRNQRLMADIADSQSDDIG